ncbi:MAG: hypothetical protein OHK0022_36380 [Roseiflexaceae bacterium]
METPNPGHRIVLDNWQPEPGHICAIIEIHGTEDQILSAIEQLGRSIDVILHIDANAIMPPDAWEHLPPRFLTPTQQAIVREDLRHTKRNLMARTLNISRHTITAYRTIIRRKFLGLPLEERPIWMQLWLRYFPGMDFAPVSRSKGTGPRTKRP